MEPFHVGIRVWCPIRYWDALYAHDLFEPKIEVTSVAAASFTALLAITILSENPIVVVDKETWNFAPRRDLSNLLLDPS